MHRETLSQMNIIYIIIESVLTIFICDMPQQGYTSLDSVLVLQILPLTRLSH